MKDAETLQRVTLQGDTRQLLKSCGQMLLLSFCLTGCRLMGNALPLAACLIAARPPGLPSVAAAFGAMLGYCLRCEGAEAVEFSALCFLLLVTGFLFQGTILPVSRWFLPLMSSLVCGILGAVRLWGVVELSFSLWCSKWLLAGLCTHGFRKGFEGKGEGRVLLYACLVGGLHSPQLSLSPGLALAVALSISRDSLLVRGATGIALDLSGFQGPCATMALTLPRLLVRRCTSPLLRYGAQILIPGAVLLFFGRSPLQLVSIAVGGVFGLMARRLYPPVSDKRAATDRRLEAAARILDKLGARIPSPREPMPEVNHVLDTATDRVCRSCPDFRSCWRNHGEETIFALSKAAESMMARGVVHKEDFPPEFRCCRSEEFVRTVNTALEAMLFRRRCRHRMEESQKVLAEEFSCMARYLRSLREEDEMLLPRFQPRVSICTAGKDGNRRNGDKTACFVGPRGRCYLLLCDGMGNGEAAEKHSKECISLLKSLLQGGVEPASALRLLNGSLLLQDSGVFSTVDLLQLDLYRGEALLCKWGSAPSYWQGGGRLEKMGTAAPPPGLGIGGPEEYRLPMSRGELLVLLSDGAFCKETEELLSACRGLSPQELAATLLAETDMEDDRTVVVLTLRPSRH